MFRNLCFLGFIVFGLILGCSVPSVSSITCEEIAEYWTGKTAANIDDIELKVLSINDVSESQRVDEEAVKRVVCKANASFADGSKNDVRLRYFKDQNGDNWYEFEPVLLTQRAEAEDSKSQTPTPAKPRPTLTAKPRPTLTAKPRPTQTPQPSVSISVIEEFKLSDAPAALDLIAFLPDGFYEDSPDLYGVSNEQLELGYGYSESRFYALEEACNSNGCPTQYIWAFLDTSYALEISEMLKNEGEISSLLDQLTQSTFANENIQINRDRVFLDIGDEAVLMTVSANQGEVETRRDYLVFVKGPVTVYMNSQSEYWSPDQSDKRASLASLAEIIAQRLPEVSTSTSQESTQITPEIFDPSVIPDNVVSVTTRELVELYDSNPIAADATYKGQIADIRGTIGSIAQAGNDIDVKLEWRTTDEDYFALRDVVCKASDIDSVLLLGEGDRIAVTGTITGVIGVMDIVVDDCMGSPVEFAKTLFRQGMSVCEQCWLDLHAYDGPWPRPESTNKFHAHSYFTLAIELTDLALASAPDDQYAKVIQIEAYRQRSDVSSLWGGEDDLKQARADIDKVLESGFVNAQDYFVRANLGYSSEIPLLQRRLMAVEHYDLAIRLDPEHANAYFSLGNAYGNIANIYSKQGNSAKHVEYRQKEIPAYTKAIELGKVAAYISRGSVYYELGQPEKRESDWDAACLLDESLYPCSFKHEWKN